ncbi:cobalamin biosynthesis protein [Pseudoduganella chitinolytica]|uniref:Cobalamin biosynthesis protein n=1 Tax=Pseudoduganella chitinolytica TaxID=34070 RepID=A0ABY8BG60_9BURK|nr:cobalamin biosynthesis protein [Pseudoduganella chitinolytica]WEF34810.1 cobalamin biosynthesis protein [Pseudoduganella chitinolytica]
MTPGPGIWLVRAEAEPLARLLQARLGGTIHRPWLQADVTQKAQFAQCWREHAQWIVVAATGIAVRFLSGLPADKHTDPAVVVLDEAGRHAIALVGGHEGGANALAYRVANVVGAAPVVTTATEAVKPLTVGIGCRKGVPAERIEAAVLHALGQAGLGMDGIREVATVDLKGDEPGLLAFCARHALPLRVLAREVLAARAWVTRPSDWVRQNVGLDGVCEPAALVASPRGALVVPKTSLDGVAVAVVMDKNDWMDKQ